MVVAFLQHAPERDVRVVAVLGHVGRRHPERIGLHLEGFLAAEERSAAEREDFGNLLVAHRVAAARRAIAMHHQMRAGAVMRTVERVRIAHVERQIVLRIRVHLAGGDIVETFRRLAVAFLDLRAEIAGPFADRIGLQQRELAVAILLPDFEFDSLLNTRTRIGELTSMFLSAMSPSSLGGIGALALAARRVIAPVLQPLTVDSAREGPLTASASEDKSGRNVNALAPTIGSPPHARLLTLKSKALARAARSPNLLTIPQ